MSILPLVFTPELLNSLGIYTPGPRFVQRAKLVANNPVAAAIYYNTIIDEFTNYILGWKDKNNGGIFGHVKAFYGMTEEQGTGTFHNHMLVWLRRVCAEIEWTPVNKYGSRFFRKNAQFFL